MNKPKISVLVPCYNNAKYLRTCLESLANQTLKDIEILLADDGTNDPEAIAIIDEFVEKDSRFYLDRHENIGCGKSMNRLLDIASGEYIAECDCDDWVEPDAYEKLYAQSEGVDVIKGTYDGFVGNNSKHVDLWDKDLLNKVVCPLDLNEDLRAKLIWSTCAMWCALYKKEFLDRENIRFRETPGAAYQDTSFTLKTKILAKSFKCVDTLVYHYNCDNEVSSTKVRAYPYALMGEYAEVEKTLKHKGINIWSLFSAIKYGGYLWMLNGLPEDMQKEFVNQMRADMQHDYFERKYFNNMQWHLLQSWGYA